MFTIPAKPKATAHITTAPGNAAALKAIQAVCNEQGILQHGVTIDMVVGRARARYTETYQRGARVQVMASGDAYLVSANGAAQIHTAVITNVRH